MATRHVLRALVGAAAGPHLPERETYRLHHHSDPPHTSSEPALLQARLLATLAQHTLDTPWSLPSHAGPLSLSDLAAALVQAVGLALRQVRASGCADERTEHVPGGHPGSARR
jgi:hypothetical protein